MRWKKHQKQILDQCRMLMTDGTVALNWEPVRSTGMSVKMLMMSMRISTTRHCKPIMDECRMWRTESIVLAHVKSG
jgi:hypothetical protein